VYFLEYFRDSEAPVILSGVLQWISTPTTREKGFSCPFFFSVFVVQFWIHHAPSAHHQPVQEDNDLGWPPRTLSSCIECAADCPVTYFLPTDHRPR